jgi:transcriptional regulator with XRE-family HTH domain
MQSEVQHQIHGKLGARLRELRLERALSVRTLATRTGFSPSFISQVEGEIVSPSLASLEKIAAELGVSLAQLFSSLESTPRTIIRRDERTRYESTWSRSVVEALTDGTPGRKLSAVQVIFEPGGASGKRTARSQHDTFALVLSGTLVLSVEDESVVLSAGDAMYLTERSVSAWDNQSAEAATLLLVGVSGQPAALVEELVDDVHPLA